MCNSKRFSLGILWLSLALLCLPAVASTITVNTLTAEIQITDGKCSFYEAIDVIENATTSSIADCGATTDSVNTILLPAGNILLTTPIQLSNKTVRVLGASSNDSVLTMANATSMSGYLWYVDELDDLTLQNLTLDTQANNSAGFILAQTSGVLRLDKTIIRNGANSSNPSQTAIKTSSAQVIIQNGVVIENNRQGIDNNGGSISISDSFIRNNARGISLANNGAITITQSKILSNTGMVGSAIYISDSARLSMNQSCVVGNTGVSVLDVNSISALSLDNNWWGRADGPSGGMNTGTGDQVSENINIDVYLETAPAQCPTLPDPVFSCDSISGITTAECLSLVNFYNATDGDNWTNNAGWLVSNDACSWYGLSCSFGFVASLQLSNNQLSGNLPSDLSAFTNLITLNLANNALSGTLNALKTLDVVETIQLSNNQFNSTLPDLSGLSDLTNLRLNNNNLTGTLPNSLNNINSLNYLELGGNLFSGTVPNLSKLTSLVLLYLDNNQFNGTVSWLTDLSNLKGLQLDYNALDLSDSATASFVSVRNPSAASTQTLPPSSLSTSTVTSDSVTLTWSPIAYQENGGFYRIEYATDATGSYQTAGQTNDKTVSEFTVTGLAENTTYYFYVRTYTPSHGSQKSNLLSEPSSVVKATTLISATPNASVKPASLTVLDFADVALNASSRVQTVSVLSVGSEAFSLNTEVTGTDSNDFQVTITPFTYTDPATGIATGDSYTVQLVCKPSALGIRSASLTLTTTPETEAFTYPLNCNGVEAPEVNVAPVAINLSNNTVNAGTANVVIGQLSTTDPNADDIHVYSLQQSDSAALSLQNNNLVVTTALTEGNYNVTIRSTDSGDLFIEQSFTISVISTAQAPTAILLSNDTVTTNTQASTGTIIGQLSTEDPSVGDTHRYRLVSDASGLFEIQGNAVIVKIGVVLNVVGDYPITINSTDSTNLFIEQSFTISVISTAQAPTAILLSNDTVTTSTQASTGTIIGQLSTVDPSVGDTHRYRLVSDASGLFEIQGNAVIVKIGVVLNAVGDYPITINSTDSTNLSIEQNFVIVITNENQPPTAIALSNNIILISDEPNTGTIIGTLSTFDSTPNDVHQYRLVNNVEGLFSLQDAILSVTAGVILDTVGTRQITVRSTDSTGLFIEQDFTIVLREIDLGTIIRGEASTATASGTELSIDTPQVVTLKAIITPVNADIGLNISPFVQLTWQSENAALAPIKLNFDLADTVLQSQNEFMLYQGALLGLVGQFTLALGYRSAIEVRDAETIIQLTVLPNRAPSNLTLSANEVVEQAEKGALIGELQAEDPDREDIFQYGLVDSAGGRFSIVDNELRVNNGFLLNYAAQNSYDITARATDRLGKFTDQTFQIKVLASGNEDRPQNLLLSKRQVKEGAPVGTIIGRFSTIGSSTAVYQYNLLDDVDGSLAIVNDLLLVSNSQLLDYESQSEHDITVQVTDLNTGEQLSKNFTILLQNQPDVQGEFKLLVQGSQIPKLQLKWTADSEHINQTAELFILLVDPSFTQLFMLTPNGWLLWDGVMSSLVGAAQVTLTAQNTVLLSAETGLEHIAFLSTGQLFFAYQLENGDLVYQPTGTPITALSMDEIDAVNEAVNP